MKFLSYFKLRQNVLVQEEDNVLHMTVGENPETKIVSAKPEQ